MKAFILTTGEYSDYRIESVWLNRKAVEDFIAADLDPETGYSKRGRWADPYNIEEWDVSHGLTPPATTW